MKTHAKGLLPTLIASAVLCWAAAEEPGPRWSAINVRVVEDTTGKPIAGASIEQLCRSCIYATNRPVTDADGTAKVMVYDKWVFLRATKDGLTNSVRLFGTNAVAEFRTNAIIRLKRASK